LDSTEFWELIDKTRQASGGDHDKHAELLVAELAKRPEAEILDYQSILDDLMDDAYIAELWDLATVINMACSDDDFMDFRAWLIGRGKDVFDRVVADPESLIDLVELHDQTTAEELLYVAMGAYELKSGKTGDTMPRRRRSPELKGKLAKDEDAMLARFPRATEKFWNYWKSHLDEWFKT
jgi:uncharacterized protein DUF4240